MRRWRRGKTKFAPLEGIILTIAEAYHVAPWAIDGTSPDEWFDIILADMDIRAEIAKEKA